MPILAIPCGPAIPVSTASPTHSRPQPQPAFPPPTLGVRPIRRPTPIPRRVPLSIPLRTIEGPLAAGATETGSLSDETPHTTLQIRRPTQALTPRPQHFVIPTLQVSAPSYAVAWENPKDLPTARPSGVEQGTLRLFAGRQASLREDPLRRRELS